MIERGRSHIHVLVDQREEAMGRHSKVIRNVRSRSKHAKEISVIVMKFNEVAQERVIEKKKMSREKETHFEVTIVYGEMKQEH